MEQVQINTSSLEEHHYSVCEEAEMAEAAEVLELPVNESGLCMARQPIFDIAMNVYAYELLHGEPEDPAANDDDDNTASCQVIINAFLDMGIESISDNLPSYIKVTHDFLVGKLPLPFPPQSIVLEIPTSLEATKEVLAGIKHFADEGFMLALDEFAFGDAESPILDLVDIVKVDIRRCDTSALSDGVSSMEKHGVRLIADNVDNQEELGLCQAAGFTHFQGNFISTPAAVSGNVLKPNRMALMNILKLLEDPNCDISDLEELISQDVTLSYKILRIINSAYYGFRRKIDSVKQAVVSLGLKVIRDWFIVISLTDIDDKPQELIFLTLQRARMMQSLSEMMCLNKDTGFTTGLFSSIDAIMDRSMDSILEALPLSTDISEALLTREGKYGELLEIVLHYERGDWGYISRAGFETGELSTFYFEAMYWARSLFEQIKSDD